MNGTMIAVDRVNLLRDLRAAQKRIVAEHEKAVAAYPAAITAWNVGAAKALHKLADRLNGKPVEGMGRSYHGELTVPITLPEMPQKPTLDCRVDRYIKVVELVDAKTFRLRTDDPIFAVVLPNRC